MQYLMVAIGGALGAMARFWVYNALLRWSGGFPWATLAVNIIGSLLLGLVFVLIADRVVMAPALRGLIAVGFLGAFTTFSTFSLDALGLIQQGAWGQALGYIAASVLVCLLAAAAGVTLGRLLI